MSIPFELRDSDKYSTKCPVCAEYRKKSNTKSLMVYRDPDGYMRYQCQHPGCEWNERQFVKDPNPMTTVKRSEDIAVGTDIQQVDALDGHPVWWYCDDDGLPLFGCLRKDFDGRKLYLPVRINADKSLTYHNTTWPDNKVLFNMQYLKDHSTVIVVEGEKAAKVGQAIFSKAAVVSWRGGAMNLGSGAWELLKGKEVILWPDNDEPGKAAMSKIGDLLPNVSYKIAKVDHLPPKSDLADNLTKEQITEAITQAQVVDKLGLGRMDFEELKAQNEFLNKRLTTGVEVLDNNVKLPMSGVVVIEGRTKHGKSAAAVYLTNSMLLTQAKTIAYFSYEIPASRVISRYARCSNPDVSLETVYNSPEMERLKPLINKKLIVYDQSAQLDLDKLLLVLDDPRWHDSVVVLDYIQIIPLRGSDRYLAIKNAMDKLRVLANKHGFVILALSQLTPNMSNPTKDTPREAQDIHFSAEAVIRLWYKDHEQPHPLYQFSEGNYTMHVLLNRDGEAGHMIGFEFIGGAAFIPRAVTSKIHKPSTEREEITTGDVKKLVKALEGLSQAMLINNGGI